MKRKLKILILLSFLIFNSTFLIPLHAQFFNALGVTVGVTYGNERWTDDNLKTSERKKYILGFNGSVLAEFFSDDYFRWVSEFQFNQKGSAEKTSAANYSTKLNYICFNNYLKFRTELVSIIPYFLIGPRLEYKLSGGSDNPRVTGAFKPLHVSLAIGVGNEFVAYGPYKFFTEAFYNPDIMKAYSVGGLHIKNNAFELRVGVKRVFGKSKKDMDCNSPVYIPDF
ncbi:MAG: outer membrane beta-barrel protein [Bacteroidetes bacterium]|nr:outer membrane beta-barrel protein [Bacteroidota bacterium]